MIDYSQLGAMLVGKKRAGGWRRDGIAAAFFPSDRVRVRKWVKCCLAAKLFRITLTPSFIYLSPLIER